jgi:hypothetical protein
VLLWIASGLVLLVIVLVAARANEIFFVSVRQGRCLVVRGRIPGVLLDGLSDVVARSRVKQGSIKAVRGQGHARLVIRGMDEGTSQRLRNVFGTHPVQKLRAASLPGKRNLGQLLGFAWLAWLLAGVAGAVGSAGHDSDRS